jgi:hypothetical protein
MAALTWIMIALVVFIAAVIGIFLLGWCAGRASGILLALDEARAVQACDNYFLTRRNRGAA